MLYQLVSHLMMGKALAPELTWLIAQEHFIDSENVVNYEVYGRRRWNLSYILNPRTRICLEKLIAAHLVNKFLVCFFP